MSKRPGQVKIYVLCTLAVTSSCYSLSSASIGRLFLKRYAIGPDSRLGNSQIDRVDGWGLLETTRHV